MNTHNICFYGEISKVIPQLSPNTLLVCSSGPKFSQTATVFIFGIKIFLIIHTNTE